MTDWLFLQVLRIAVGGAIALPILVLMLLCALYPIILGVLAPLFLFWLIGLGVDG